MTATEVSAILFVGSVRCVEVTGGDQGGGAAQVHDHGDPPAVGARLHTTGGMNSV